jgi:tetratricopeptide (TPR) repeat protein
MSRRRVPWLSAVFALPLAAGCAELPYSAKQELSKAGDDYRRQDYRAAQTKLDGIITTYKAYTGAADAYYLRALCEVGLGNKAAALKDAEQCIALSKDKMLTAEAHAMAGTLNFEAGNDVDAIDHFAKALNDLPEKPPADLIRYRYAVCLQRQGRWSDARREFGILIQRYPSGDIGENARRMVEWKGDYFTIQCGLNKEPASAAKQVQTLRKSGQVARVEAQTRLGKTVYVVCIGEYPTYAAAQDALRAIRAKVSNAVIAP